MRNKIRLLTGWFGVLTPVYAAGALTVLLALGNTDWEFAGTVGVVSCVNFIIGRKLLNSMAVIKEVKRHGNHQRINRH